MLSFICLSVMRSIYSFHRVSLSVRYAFNATKSKYKGKGAGQDVIKRL